MVAKWTRSFPMPTKLTHHTLLNPKGVMAWKTDGPTQGRCVWDYHDVWRWSKAEDKAVVLRENYFRLCPESGKEVSSTKIREKILLLIHASRSTFMQISISLLFQDGANV